MFYYHKPVNLPQFHIISVFEEQLNKQFDYLTKLN